MNILPKLGLFFLLGVIACKDAEKHKLDSVESLQTTIDTVRLISLNEQPVDIKKYKGKTVFINFWATWCKPCLEEMPSIQKAKELRGLKKNRSLSYVNLSTGVDSKLS